MTFHRKFIIPLSLVAIGAAAFTVYANNKNNKPTSVNLSVPFTTQAPIGNWDNNEDCEETSAVMAHAFLTGNTHNPLPADLVLQEVQAMNKWESEHYGHTQDSGAADTARFVEAVYELKTKVIANPSIEDIQAVLADKKVVLLPIAGAALQGTGYNNPPPPYHMIVIRGYNEKGFYVNDPGVSDGENKLFTYDNIMNAIADWDSGKNTFDKNTKNILVVYK